jgi:hypothetical protein
MVIMMIINNDQTIFYSSLYIWSCYLNTGQNSLLNTKLRWKANAFYEKNMNKVGYSFNATVSGLERADFAAIW